MQYVKVDLDGKAYTYGWTGVEPLKRGDRVEVPGNVVNPKPSVRTVLRPMPGPDYDVDKIVNILSKVETVNDSHEPGPLCDDECQPGLGEPGRQHTDRPEPHDWDDLIGDLGDDSAAEKFDDYVAEDAHATRLQRWDGVDPSADDLPEDAARMMQKRHVDALPDEQRGQ